MNLTPLIQGLAILHLQQLLVRVHIETCVFHGDGSERIGMILQ
jgi:hypothetical protein